MKYLTLEQRDALQRALERRSRELRLEIDAALKAAGDSGLRLANHYQEVDDEAIADLEGSLDVASLERDLRELRTVGDALVRLHTADYGECADCGDDIPFTRLLAVPTASRCTGCETAHEFAGATVARHTL